MTTLEEAKRCPRCQQPGELTGLKRALPAQRGVTRGATLDEVKCKNSRCKWFETSYYIQINPDGSIPPAVLHRDKNYPALPNDHGRTEEAIARLQENLKKPDFETRGR